MDIDKRGKSITTAVQYVMYVWRGTQYFVPTQKCENNLIGRLHKIGIVHFSKLAQSKLAWSVGRANNSKSVELGSNQLKVSF